MKMLEKMKDIVKGNDLCVLATVSEGKPHCSLMSYISRSQFSNGSHPISSLNKILMVLFGFFLCQLKFLDHGIEVFG